MNGIPIQEVWKRLGAEFPPEDVRRHPSTNMEYVSMEKIGERPNAVVGMENWNFFPIRHRFVGLGRMVSRAAW